MKSRADIVIDPTKNSLLDPPKDILRAITAVASDAEALTIKRNLSKTCTSLRFFFQPFLDESDTQRLLSYVLQGNAKEAKKMYDANPRLLFIEATAKEYAAGLDEQGEPVPRIQTESPFKAAARAGDIWLLKDIKERLEKIPNQHTRQVYCTLAEEQLAKVFLNGFEYPPSTYNFENLVQAITHDPVLIGATSFVNPGQASPDTEKVLAQFRKNFLPGSKKVDYHFNLNDLVKACEIYNSNCCNGWNQYQAAVFWCQVVGYFQRLVSACDAQALCQGIKKVLGNRPVERSFKFNPWDHGIKKISYFPLDVDSSCFLGGSFAVDSYLAGRGTDGISGGWGRRRLLLLKSYVDLKQQGLNSLSNNCTGLSGVTH